jgi:hypothetical protein
VHDGAANMLCQLYNNRAAARLGLHNPVNALEDALASIRRAARDAACARLSGCVPAVAVVPLVSCRRGVWSGSRHGTATPAHGTHTHTHSTHTHTHTHTRARVGAAASSSRATCGRRPAS